MLNKKRFGIRLSAIIMSLLMVAAVFAGCQDKTALDEVEKVKADAEAAIKAAADANAAAVSAANAAKALEEQLKAAQKQIEEQQKLIDEQEKAKEQLESKIEQIEKQPPSGTGDSIGQKPWDETTLVTRQILEEVAALKTKYLVTRQTHYTEVNYTTLTRLFDQAYNDLYRATTPDGVKNVVAKLSADAAAVTSISTEAAAIKAQIEAIGDLNKLTIANKKAITDIVAAYEKLLKDYKTYFTMNGMSVDSYSTNAVVRSTIRAYTKSTFSINYDFLETAQNTIALLEGYAADVSKKAYDAIAAVWGKEEFNDIKTSGAAIKAAYELYLNFINMNGGDGSPIKYTDSTTKRVLTGEEFVQLYVYTLYDNWVYQYAEKADDFLQKLPEFFMYAGSVTLGDSAAQAHLATLGSKYLGIYKDLDSTKVDYSYETGAVIKSSATISTVTDNSTTLNNELKRIARDYSAKFISISYSEDFKRTQTLSDAFRAIDNEIAKAATEMASLYFKKVLVTAIKAEMAEDFTANVENVFKTSSETVQFYKDADKAFYENMKKVYDAYVAKTANYTTKTYDELNKLWNSDRNLYNISQLYLFSYEIDTNGDVKVVYNSNDALNSLALVLKYLNDTVKTVEEDYYEELLVAQEAITFHEYRKTLAKKLDSYRNDVISTASDSYIDLVGKVRSFSASEKTAIQNSTENMLQAARKALMDLDYYTFKSYTYQATDSKGNKLYHDKAAHTSAKFTTTATDKNPVMIVVDQEVAARAAAIGVYAEYADKMMNTVMEYARSTVKSYITKSVDSYNNNYANDNAVTTLKADIAAYVQHLTVLSDLNATSLRADYDKELKKAVSYTSSSVLHTVMTNMGYELEVVDATNYVYYYHVTKTSKYANADDVTTDHKALALKTVQNYAYVATPDHANNAYKSLEKVRQLAYQKDQAILDLQALLVEYTGIWDASKGEWKTNPKLAYDYNSTRKVAYLDALDKVYDKLEAAILGVTLLNSSNNYTTALDKINKYLNDYAEREQDNKKASESYDDYSFVVAYRRYYQVTNNGEPTYDWSKYNA